jgi:8-oxo-dGTP pyrophosphatase MutT (NUDIX family)
MEKWETTSSKILVEDKWLKLRIDSYVTPAGGEVPAYYVLEYGDWANCVVIDSDNQLIMIRQYRHGIDDFVPEFVAGGIEKEDPTPEIGMKRELEEEIGYVGGELYRTGISYPNPASQTNKVYSFLAVGGSCSQNQKLEAGETITIEKVPLEELLKNLENPDSEVIYQSLHIAALFFALNFINKSSLESLRELKAKLAVKAKARFK